MSHLLENRPDAMASVVKYIDNSLLQFAIEMQMRCWFSTSNATPPQVYAAIWAEVDAIGEVDVRMYFGDEIDRPTAADADGLLHTFDPGLSYECLSIEVQKLSREWATEDTVIRMLSNAHARLSAEINQIRGVAA